MALYREEIKKAIDWLEYQLSEGGFKGYTPTDINAMKDAQQNLTKLLQIVELSSLQREIHNSYAHKYIGKTIEELTYFAD